MLKFFISAGELIPSKSAYDAFSIICFGLTCEGTKKRYLCKLFIQEIIINKQIYDTDNQKVFERQLCGKMDRIGARCIHDVLRIHVRGCTFSALNPA